METKDTKESRKTVVLDRDLFETSEYGSKVLVARKGERVDPEFARKHGVLPIESAGMPDLEAKVVRPVEHQQMNAASHKRLF
tara:strand:+ start:165 stop:410 length:246 start_codon:yes stop_codon:yes gene_type:complete